MSKETGKSLAEMVAEVTSDGTESQATPKAKSVNGFKVFKENNERLKELVYKMTERIDLDGDCSCMHALDGSRM